MYSFVTKNMFELHTIREFSGQLFQFQILLMESSIEAIIIHRIYQWQKIRAQYNIFTPEAPKDYVFKHVCYSIATDLHKA